jgi:hypothetical protein
VVSHPFRTKRRKDGARSSSAFGPDEAISGSGAVWNPQAKHLANKLPQLFALFLLFLASRSAWSLYSPCGPLGRASTLTQIIGSGLGSNGGSVCRFTSNPRLVNSLISAAANSIAAGAFVDWIITPVWTDFISPFQLPPSRISIIPPGALVVMRPDLSASAISLANISASVEEALNQMLTLALGPKLASAAPISRFCLSLNDLQPTAASILTRARCSSSASLRSCAAPLVSSPAVFSASPDFLSAAAVFASAIESTSDSCALNLASAFEAKPSYVTSATIPQTTSNKPKAAMGIPQLFGSSLMVRSLLARNQFLTDIAVSQISSKHPKATTPPEISERVNHFALSASSDNLTGSGAPLWPVKGGQGPIEYS